MKLKDFCYEHLYDFIELRCNDAYLDGKVYSGDEILARLQPTDLECEAENAAELDYEVTGVDITVWVNFH